jgi:DNA-binding CsgD family transcriptional regulator
MFKYSAVATIGSSFFFAWGFLSHLSPALLYSPNSTNIEYAYFASLGGSALFALLICLKAVRKQPFIPPGVILILASLLSVFTLLEALATTMSHNVLILVIFGILDGICLPLLVIAWGTRFTWETSSMSSVVLLSYVLAILLYFTIAALQPRLIATAVTVLLPLLSAIVWYFDLRSRRRLVPELNHRWLRQGNGSFGEMVSGITSLNMLPWFSLIILALTTFLCALISSIMARLTYDISSRIAVYGFLFGMLLCLTCLLVIKLYPSRFSVESMSHCLLPLIVLGMVAILVFGTEGLILSVSILRAAGFLFEIVVLLLIAYATQQKGLSPLFSFSLAVAVVNFVMFSGHIAGLPLYFMFGVAQGPINIIVGFSVVIIFVLIMVAYRHLNTRIRSFPAKETLNTQHELMARQFSDNEWDAALDDKVQRFSQSYGLSSRECEVVSLLVRGRSTPKIAESMFITSGTVKTHLTHIYRKMDILGRQELIDLFDVFI